MWTEFGHFSSLMCVLHANISSPIGQERIVDKVVDNWMPRSKINFRFDFNAHFFHSTKLQAILMGKGGRKGEEFKNADKLSVQ